MTGTPESGDWWAKLTHHGPSMAVNLAHRVILGPESGGETHLVRTSVEQLRALGGICVVSSRELLFDNTGEWSPEPGTAWGSTSPVEVLSKAHATIVSRSRATLSGAAADDELPVMLVILDDPDPEVLGERVVAADVMAVLVEGQEHRVLLLLTARTLDGYPPALLEAFGRFAEVSDIQPSVVPEESEIPATPEGVWRADTKPTGR